MIPLELVYRSRPIQYPLLAAMKACKAWEQSGIELKSVKFVSKYYNIYHTLTYFVRNCWMPFLRFLDII